MNKSDKQQLAIIVLIFILVVALSAIIYMTRNFTRETIKLVPMPIQSQEPRPRFEPGFTKDRPDTRNTPEFRGPPLKHYKPGQVQQVGILFDTLTKDTLPLFGKETPYRRDSYMYYATDNGSLGSNAMMSLPLVINGRDCDDQHVGCNELYGGETVSVFGKDNQYEAKIYRTENFY